MEFNINQSQLLETTTVVLKGISSTSTMPVLSGIEIEAIDNNLILQATDLNLSIKYTVNALVEQPGKTVIPGKLFSDILKTLPNEAVNIKTEENSAIITCATSSFSIKTLNAEDFPEFPTVDINQEIVVPYNKFSSMIKKVQCAVSRKEENAIWSGVLLKSESSTLKMVATDSYRLAICETPLNGETTENFEAIVPGSFLMDLAMLNNSEDDVRIGLNENQIIVTYNNSTFISRKLEGKYPPYENILPNSFNTTVKLNKQQLLQCVKRANILNSQAASVKLSVDITNKTVQLSSTASDVGSIQDVIPFVGEGEGENNEVKFGCKYTIDGLNSIQDENVNLLIKSIMKPAVLKSEDNNFMYLIMPVTTK